MLADRHGPPDPRTGTRRPNRLHSLRAEGARKIILEVNNTTAGGIGFCGLLAVAFIVLKLTGVINWSWLWVLAPIWIPTAITLAIIVIVLVVILVRELTKGGRP